MIKNGNPFPADSTASDRYFSPALRKCKAMSPTAPLNGVQELIHDRIWNALLDGKLRPGTKLPEEQIGMIFKVSRTVVRKVLIVMEQEGIVSLPLNRGAYVTIPTPEKIHNIFEAASLVSCHLVGTMASNSKKLPDGVMARLQLHHEVQKNAIESQDLQAARRLSLEFLLLLADIHQNKIFASQQEQAMSHIVMAMLLHQRQPSERQLLEVQNSILEAIGAGKEVEAREGMAKYLDTINESLKRSPVDQGSDLRSILSEGLDLSGVSRRGKSASKAKIPA